MFRLIFPVLLTLAVLIINIALPVGASACGVPVLFEKFEQLSPKRQAALTKALDSFKSLAGQYDAFVGGYEVSRRNWLSGNVTLEDEEIQAEFLIRGISLVQQALETYNIWNDGAYPENLDYLLCKECAVLTRLCENPFTAGVSKQITLGSVSPGNFWYIPEYSVLQDSRTVTGYWLVILGNDSLKGNISQSKLFKPMPGGLEIPRTAWMVLESHLE